MVVTLPIHQLWADDHANIKTPMGVGIYPKKMARLS